MLWGESRRSSEAGLYVTTVCGTNWCSTGFRSVAKSSVFTSPGSYFATWRPPGPLASSEIANFYDTLVLTTYFLLIQDSTVVTIYIFAVHNSHTCRPAAPQIVNKIGSKLYKRTYSSNQCQNHPEHIGPVGVYWRHTDEQELGDFGSVWPVQMGKYGLPWKCC